MQQCVMYQVGGMYQFFVLFVVIVGCGYWVVVIVVQFFGDYVCVLVLVKVDVDVYFVQLQVGQVVV